jgi:hypothetical protein
MGNLKKTDFEKIAKIIKGLETSLNQNNCTTGIYLYDLCDYLATTNKDFKRNEFLKLCGVDEE